MRKNNYPADQSSLICRETLDSSFPSRQGGSELKVEEFGISARDELSPDILLKLIAYESDGSTTTQVFLCYNWKRRSRFVLVRREVLHKTTTYNRQYGHEDNYPENKWTETTNQFYSPEELPIRRPEIAAFLQTL